MKLLVDSLEYSAEKAAILAELGNPLSKMEIEALMEDGFSVARGLSRHCMSWIWLHWLRATPAGQIQTTVKAFVDKGMSMQEKSTLFYMRPHADLYLLHCAIFASSRKQLEKLAGRLVDASGIEGHTPEDKGGEMYASAWCGMLKYWILGDLKKAEQQSELIWSAYRCPSFAAASKPLVTQWLKGDWSAFVKAQRKDFDRLWARGRKDGTVQSEKGDEIAVTVLRYPIEQKWCWAHCGLALLAHRQGVEVATDSFWFPAHALKCVSEGK